MSKEKNTKTQSRKKQVTDVSDALFHVTPQPSIDIFEALGGAINVQTAAFLTGKVDYLGQNQMPAHHEQNSTPLQSEKLMEAKDLKLIQKGQNKGKNAPNEQEVANEISHSSSVNLDTLEPEKVPAKPTPESNTIHEFEAVQEHGTIMDNQEKPNILDSHYAYEHDTNNAKTPAIYNDSAHSTAISTACHDQKNSMLNSKSDIQHDSREGSTDNITEISTPTSIASHPQNSTQNSIENNPHEEQTYSLYHTKTSTPKSIEKNTKEQHTDHTYAPQKSTKNAVNNPQNSTIQGPHLLTQLTKREEELLQFLRHHHGQIVSYSQILKALNWRESQRCTARNIVARFETNGIIQRQRIQGTRSQGYLFTMCEQNPYDSIHTPPYAPRQNTNNITYSMANSIDRNIGTYASAHSMQNSIAESYDTITQNSIGKTIHTSTANSMPSYIDKIDRLIQSIWQSDQDTIEACWPYVAKAGLRSAHLRQLEKVFELQGFESGTVSLGLRYLDWQLEQGPLSNARGEFIEDPVAYWLTSMRRNGYYNKPKGYVDPLLEAKRLLAEEAESKLAMQARLEQVRMENEAAQEEQRCEHLFNALMEQGTNHALWPAFYQSLPQMHRQKVDAEGPVALLKKFAMLRTFIKGLL